VIGGGIEIATNAVDCVTSGINDVCLLRIDDLPFAPDCILDVFELVDSIFGLGRVDVELVVRSTHFRLKV
jgi:hypothetical protein